MYLLPNCQGKTIKNQVTPEVPHNLTPFVGQFFIEWPGFLQRWQVCDDGGGPKGSFM